MKALIFSEGNGYGHAARDRIISEHFDFPLMTYGKGAEFCQNNSIDFIEIPSPYVIQSGRKVQIVSEPTDLIGFMKPDVLATIVNHFRKVDLVIVDGTPLGLAVAMFARKKTVYITNDTAALVGVHGVLEKKVANSFLKALLRSTSAIVVPDFAPPLSITLPNLNTSFPLVFAGPFVTKSEQISHGKEFLVPGNLAGELRPILGDRAVYGDQTDFSSCYEDADIVFSHGGHTTIMEALSFGRPVVSIVEKAYSERYNNSLMLERRDVGVALERSLLSEESLLCSIEYAKTLDKDRLQLYKRMSQMMDPVDSLRRIISSL
ncbi:MAG: glycosyltransferase [Candidatus Micrarchaeia archaeon]